MFFAKDVFRLINMISLSLSILSVSSYFLALSHGYEDTVHELLVFFIHSTNNTSVT